MRVRILARMPANGYSGGRLYALTMAEGLALAGAEVDFVADAMPEMYEEFRSFSKVRLITANLQNLSPLADRRIDVVVVVPAQGDYYTHGEFVRHGLECHAKIVMINFESPNWFNAVSPRKRDPMVWKGWDIVSEYCDMILSISGEGDKWAREYYVRAPRRCMFGFVYPAVNSVLADQAPNPSCRKKQIVFLTRIDAHKGYDLLKPLAISDLEGYTVTMNISQGNLSAHSFKTWRNLFENAGVNLRLVSGISSQEKFALFKESALNFFPTRFEGFGLPPLEAAYCMCPTACSDLPVLREVGRDAYVYGNPDNEDEMRRAIVEALDNQEALAENHPRIAEIARLECYGSRALALLTALF